MRAPLHCDESSLRKTLALPMGTDPGELLLDAITGGIPIEVEMNDGGLLLLESPEAAAEFLADKFGWTHQPHIGSDGYPNPHVRAD